MARVLESTRQKVARLDVDTLDYLLDVIAILRGSSMSDSYILGLLIGMMQGRLMWSADDVAKVLVVKPPDDDMIDDDFGNSTSAWCQNCGKKTMVVVRPGKFQCTECE